MDYMFAKIKIFFCQYKQKLVSYKDETRSFIKDMVIKFKDLYRTNYDTGMYHLKNGNVWDATFRFRIMSKLWTKQLEGKYYYAYCLLLNRKIEKAESILVSIQNDYPDAQNLLNKIRDNNAENIIDEYNSSLTNKN